MLPLREGEERGVEAKSPAPREVYICNDYVGSLRRDSRRETSSDEAVDSDTRRADASVGILDPADDSFKGVMSPNSKRWKPSSTPFSIISPMLPDECTGLLRSRIRGELIVEAILPGAVG